MARFIFPIVVLAIVALYTNQVVSEGGVEAVSDDNDPNACSTPDASDCAGKPGALGCSATVCCSNLKYSASNNGSTWGFSGGKCTCCAESKCLTQYSIAEAETPNTDSDAFAVNVICEAPAK